MKRVVRKKEKGRMYEIERERNRLRKEYTTKGIHFRKMPTMGLFTHDKRQTEREHGNERESERESVCVCVMKRERVFV